MANPPTDRSRVKRGKTDMDQFVNLPTNKKSGQNDRNQFESQVGITGIIP